MRLRQFLTLFYICLAHFALCQSAGGYEIKDRHTSVNLQADGSALISERLRVNFTEQRRGIYRSIPYIYNRDGEVIKLSIDDVEVKKHQSLVTREGNDIRIRIGKPEVYLTGEQLYEISYRVDRAIADYKTHDEFYWDLIDFDTDAITHEATFAISYPRSWEGHVKDYLAWSGRAGSKEHQLELLQRDNKLVGKSKAPLRPREGITVSLKIPKGIVKDSALIRPHVKPHWLLNWWNLIPVALLSILTFFYNKIDGSPTITNPPLKTYPPEDLTPAEVGTFIDYQANRRDVLSLIPYWGNQGLLKVTPVVMGKGDMYFYKLGELPQDAMSYEHYLFDRLFADGDVVLLSDLKERFHLTMSSTAADIKKTVQDMPLYDHTSKRLLHSGWMLGIGLIMIGVGISVGIIIESPLFIVGMVLIGIACIVIHFLRPKLSDRGIRVQSHLLGLYDHLKRPDPETINELIQSDPDYLHKMYPYALAFGLDKTWTTFEKTIKSYTPPIWYDYGHGPFMYSTISDGFDIRAVEDVMYSTPPASNTSSGGGFSGGSGGGGFGGGSTGSW